MERSIVTPRDAVNLASPLSDRKGRKLGEQIDRRKSVAPPVVLGPQKMRYRR
jgi:hypothetical protein